MLKILNRKEYLVADIFSNQNYSCNRISDIWTWIMFFFTFHSSQIDNKIYFSSIVMKKYGIVASRLNSQFWKLRGNVFWTFVLYFVDGFFRWNLDRKFWKKVSRRVSNQLPAVRAVRFWTSRLNLILLDPPIESQFMLYK